MANSFYQTGPARAARVGDLFSAIAPRYDLINDLQSFGFHRYWKRQMLRFAQVQPGERTLDVCCGTGDLAFGLARLRARVTAVDFSSSMLRYAQERGTRALSWPVQWVKADALNLPFPGATFQVVTVGYGLRNLADFRAGIQEMHRVLKPGGRLLVLDFGKPRQPVVRRAYFAYLRRFVPMLGRLFGGNAAAYAYILESLRNYPAQEGVAACMRELGCGNVQVINLLGGVMSINYGRKGPLNPEAD